MKIWNIAIIAFVHLCLWMLLVDDRSLRDFLIGLFAVSLTTIAVIRAGRLMNVQFRPSVRQLAEAWRIPWYILTGTVELLQAMTKQIVLRRGADSILSAIPFHYGGADAQSVGRRTLATTFTTITPNSIVLGWIKSSDGRESYMLLHQVKRSEVHQLTKNLGAHE